jgi:hypothetical protein
LRKSDKPYVLGLPFHLKVPSARSLIEKNKKQQAANKKMMLTNLIPVIDKERRANLPNPKFRIRLGDKAPIEKIKIMMARMPKKSRILCILQGSIYHPLSV